MSREIKFRAWDRVKKVMLEDVAVYSGGHGGIEYGYALDAYGSDDNLPEEQGEEWVFLMQHDFLQFTGLKDKNGKEIYEGDIITGHTSFENYNDERDWTKDNPYVVGWSDECAGFMPFILNTRWRCDVINIEVIGNFYENPDLLNSDKNGAVSDTTEAEKSGEAGSKTPNPKTTEQ